MSWIYLIIAILAEVVGTTFMKLSQGFSKLLPSIMIFVFYGLSLTLLTLSLKKIDVSVAYAIWSGLGTAFIATIGILLFKESVSIVKVLSIFMIIAGVIGLNLAEGTHGGEDNILQSIQINTENDIS
ncbi:multidrug efflux SMR transporter [Pseudogracilibacillus sp. SE30717A]|uniref:DMT family transporter n=1 Tax=Pseudogracilibacillus sp. SE30717A TaxID=3098293 RepID=UPI00300E596A